MGERVIRTELTERFGIDYPIFGFTPSQEVAAAIGAGASLRTPPLIGAAIALGGLVLALLLVRRTPAVGAVPHDGPSAATV